MRAVSVVLVSGALFGAVELISAQQSPPPQFRAEINYVEVDARVVDEQGRPIRGLTQRDFALFEDGVRQTLTNFSVVDIPVAAPPAPVTTALVKPDVVTNTQTGRRMYLIVFDGTSVEVRWTGEVRAFLRRFVERSVGPDDLVGIASTGCDDAHENFTNSKPRLLATINRMVGQKESKCFVGQDDPLSATNPMASRETEAHLRQRQLVEIIQAMSATGPGSKAIIYVSDGISFDPSVMNTEGLSLIGDVERVAARARLSNVPIYPVDPRGLSSGFEAAAEERSIGLTDGDPALKLLNETRCGQDSLRIMADDSGGIPIVGVNDLNGAMDRIVGLTSFYYVLGYYSTNPRRDGKYRKINVTVDRPGARALNRRGYTAAVTGTARQPKLAGPPKSSIELREALNTVLPVSGLPLLMTAAAFRQANNHASVAVVLETSGSDLVWQNDVLAAPLEMTAAALEKRGGIKAGDFERLSLSSRTDTSTRVRQYGFRWLARLDDLKSGRYQIRGAASNGPAKQGSVWYELDVPDFGRDPLTMSDVMLASAVAMLRPTLRPDKRLMDALPGPPTTLREFPEGGSIAIYAEVYDNQLERAHEVEAVINVTNERGESVFRKAESRTNRQIADAAGVFGLQTGIPLINMKPGPYTLTVEVRQKGGAATISRSVPFQVVRP